MECKMTKVERSRCRGESPSERLFFEYRAVFPRDPPRSLKILSRMTAVLRPRAGVQRAERPVPIPFMRKRSGRSDCGCRSYLEMSARPGSCYFGNRLTKRRLTRKATVLLVFYEDSFLVGSSLFHFCRRSVSHRILFRLRAKQSHYFQYTGRCPHRTICRSAGSDQ